VRPSKYELRPEPLNRAPMTVRNTTGKRNVKIALCGFRQNDSCS
jgi:hypothetical protein